MAETEDTELRDLVIEALEKNGSLAKIRALLRANIFLAFEDECENMRHNLSLDTILKVPEGIYALSIVHEFLEFCNLKNTLFVYKSESRQGKDYKYDGKKLLLDNLNLKNVDITREPVLITLIKKAIKPNYKNHNDNSILKKLQDCGDVFKDEQNSSYIVHEDSQSSTTNTSQSDNSMDEKNKMHLRLHLDNSDTDTSTDSSRSKSASEYIPSEHVMEAQNINNSTIKSVADIKDDLPQRLELSLPNYITKGPGNSSESTSYVELKPYTSIDKQMLNTSGLPNIEINNQPEQKIASKNHSDQSKSDSGKSGTLSSVSSLSMKNEHNKLDSFMSKKMLHESTKSDGETAEYSYDFSTSHESRNKQSDRRKTPESPKDLINEEKKTSPLASPHQNSHSSVSISDVAELISDKSSSFENHSSNDKSMGDNLNVLSSKKSATPRKKLSSDDSGDFTESPIPSLSNLSLDIHSD